jgi:hypothetical protein
MTPTPTLHLRFIERDVHIPVEPMSNKAMHKRVRILQQFWEYPDGEELRGDMFKIVCGKWLDVPLEKES